MKAEAILVAGGQGTRMGSIVPKQLHKLGRATILEHTLSPFLECRDIQSIVIVAATNIFEHIEGLVQERFTEAKPIAVVHGGSRRQDSVYKGLMALKRDTDIVAVHDSVRPFITPELITDCLRRAENFGAVSVMRPLKETVKRVQDRTVIETPERSTLWITQTPQAFRKELILEAHNQAEKHGYTGTDDCMLVERLGHTVHVIEGSDINIKITTQTDLAVAETILKLFENGRA
ncbi:2-C-methyl-D-erythritol 4-phosphate cytidylyltransferase [Candidatus Omnitrophota bacterium]